MLRSVITAVVSALRSLGRLVGRTTAAPFVALNSLIGGGGGVAGAPIEIPEVAAPEVVVPSKAVDNTRLYEDIAIAVMTWCADSLIADTPAPVSTKLPLGVREWLPGLTRVECDAIIEADKTAVSAHLQRLFDLHGVRPVQPLRPLREWPPAPMPMMAPDTDGFAAIAARYELARSAAAE
jgi:hypothetical protein